MTDEADYADRLRETLLALAIVPLAGFETATYWLTESLDRTSRFGADVLASTALARFTRPRQSEPTGSEAGGQPDPVAEVLARDLLDTARIYVRSMVRLPADAGVYFTGELERRLNDLLERIQPEAEKDLDAYVDTEMQRLLQELDRLFVAVRAQARRSVSAPSEGDEAGLVNQPTADKLVEDVDALRKRVRAARPPQGEAARRRLVVEGPAAGTEEAFRIARAHTRARMRLRQAVRDAEALVPDERQALDRLDALIEEYFPPRSVAPKEGG